MLNRIGSRLVRAAGVAALATAAVLPLAIPSTAHAWWWRGGGVYVGVPAPIVVAPPPVVYAPPPYYAPPPVAYARPVWFPGHWAGGYWVPGHWG